VEGEAEEVAVVGEHHAGVGEPGDRPGAGRDRDDRGVARLQPQPGAEVVGEREVVVVDRVDADLQQELERRRLGHPAEPRR
jgi:hypothetical protein